MNKRFRFGLVFAFSVLILISTPLLRAQEGDTKGPVDKVGPEQKTVEKSHSSDTDKPCEQKTAEKSPAHSLGGRCELTTCVTKVLYFPNLSQPTELQDVVNTLRVIAEISRVQSLFSARVVVVQGTPEQVALAEKLVDEIDKAKRKFGGVGYRLDFKISESQGDKKLRSRVYSLVTEGRDTAKLSIGEQAPTQNQGEAASENKQSPDAVAGRSIEFLILAENERTIDLRVDVAFSISSTRDSGKDEKAGLPGLANPVPAQLRVKDHITLELSKPTVISVLDDPDSERTFQIEMTATRIKEK